MNQPRSLVFALTFAALLGGCAHHLVTLDVRAADTGLAREFTYEAKSALLTAESPEGTLFKLWMHTKAIRVEDEHRTIPPGCHGGILWRRTEVGARPARTVVTLCPREGAPAGWQGWHVDLEQFDRKTAQVSLPPAVLFDIQLSEPGDELLIATESSRAKVSIPAMQAKAFHEFPEALAFIIISGIVPIASHGVYEAVER